MRQAQPTQLRTCARSVSGRQTIREVALMHEHGHEPAVNAARYVEGATHVEAFALWMSFIIFLARLVCDMRLVCDIRLTCDSAVAGRAPSSTCNDSVV